MRGRRPQATFGLSDGTQRKSARALAGTSSSSRPRKEVIQPQVPLRLPCYDFAPVADLTVVGCLLLRGQRTGFGESQLPWRDGRCVQGPGTYSPRHADPRLLAIPTSCTRVAECNPN